MNYELLFTVANASVIPAWLLLILAPKAQVTSWMARSYLYPVVLGLFYIYLFFSTLGGEGGMDSIASVREGFEHDGVLLLGWVHYLVFDLFIGAWEVRDAQKQGISHFLIVPSLVLTLLLGPIGLLTYLTIRWMHTRSLQL
jgi:hypothetical protein